MADYGAQLFLVRTVAEGRVQRLATGNAVLIVVAPSVGACNQVLYACFAIWDGLLAEEAAVALEKKEAVKLFQFGSLTFDMSGKRRTQPLTVRSMERVGRHCLSSAMRVTATDSAYS